MKNINEGKHRITRFARVYTTRLTIKTLNSNQDIRNFQLLRSFAQKDNDIEPFRIIIFLLIINKKINLFIHHFLESMYRVNVIQFSV